MYVLFHETNWMCKCARWILSGFQWTLNEYSLAFRNWANMLWSKNFPTNCRKHMLLSCNPNAIDQKQKKFNYRDIWCYSFLNRAMAKYFNCLAHKIWSVLFWLKTIKSSIENNNINIQFIRQQKKKKKLNERRSNMLYYQKYNNRFVMWDINSHFIHISVHYSFQFGKRWQKRSISIDK